MGVSNWKNVFVITLLILLIQLTNVESRKRKQQGQQGRLDDELDEFSGDSYAEFVDKYYKGGSNSGNSGQKKGEGVGVGRYVGSFVPIKQIVHPLKMHQLITVIQDPILQRKFPA